MADVEGGPTGPSEGKDDLSGLLAWTVRWVESQFDGNWEHGRGFSLGLVDNPGWTLRIDVSNHDVSRTTLLPIKESDVDHTRFFFAEVTADDVFDGICDATQLERLLRVFRSLIETSPERPSDD